MVAAMSNYTHDTEFTPAELDEAISLFRKVKITNLDTVAKANKWKVTDQFSGAKAMEGFESIFDEFHYHTSTAEIYKVSEIHNIWDSIFEGTLDIAGLNPDDSRLVCNHVWDIFEKELLKIHSKRGGAEPQKKEKEAETPAANLKPYIREYKLVLNELSGEFLKAFFQRLSAHEELAGLYTENEFMEFIGNNSVYTRSGLKRTDIADFARDKNFDGNDKTRFLNAAREIYDDIADLTYNSFTPEQKQGIIERIQPFKSSYSSEMSDYYAFFWTGYKELHPPAANWGDIEMPIDTLATNVIKAFSTSPDMSFNELIEMCHDYAAQPVAHIDVIGYVTELMESLISDAAHDVINEAARFTAKAKAQKARDLDSPETDLPQMGGA